MVRKRILYNNVAFAYAEGGRLEIAEQYLGRIADRIHRDPYPTATLGLIDFKKGNIKRGSERYEEAISVAVSRPDKRRIRQKYYLELGKYLIESDHSKALRLLRRAASIGQGEPELAVQAQDAMRALTHQ